MRTVVLPDAITVIEEGAFQECGNAVKITLPPKLTMIGSNAFVDCWRVVEINLPDTLRFLMQSAFEHCESLSTLTFSPTLKTALKHVGYFVFDGCFSLADNVKTGWEVHLDARDFAKYGRVLPADCYSGGSDTLCSMALPDAVTTIANFAFSHQKGLRELVLPPHIKHVGKNAFYRCSGIEKFVALRQPEYEEGAAEAKVQQAAAEREKAASARQDRGCLRGCINPGKGLHHRKCPQYAPAAAAADADSAEGSKFGLNMGENATDRFNFYDQTKDDPQPLPPRLDVSAPDHMVAELKLPSAASPAPSSGYYTALADLPDRFRANAASLQLQHYFWHYELDMSVCTASAKEFVWTLMLVGESVYRAEADRLKEVSAGGVPGGNDDRTERGKHMLEPSTGGAMVATDAQTEGLTEPDQEVTIEPTLDVDGPKDDCEVDDGIVWVVPDSTTGLVRAPPQFLLRGHPDRLANVAVVGPEGALSPTFTVGRLEEDFKDQLEEFGQRFQRNSEPLQRPALPTELWLSVLSFVGKHEWGLAPQ